MVMRSLPKRVVEQPPVRRAVGAEREPRRDLEHADQERVAGLGALDGDGPGHHVDAGATVGLGDAGPQPADGVVHQQVGSVAGVVGHGLDAHDVAGADLEHRRLGAVEVAPEAGLRRRPEVVARRPTAPRPARPTIWAESEAAGHGGHGPRRRAVLVRRFPLEVGFADQNRSRGGTGRGAAGAAEGGTAGSREAADEGSGEGGRWAGAVREQQHGGEGEHVREGRSAAAGWPGSRGPAGPSRGPAPSRRRSTPRWCP